MINYEEKRANRNSLDDSLEFAKEADKQDPLKKFPPQLQ